MILNANFALLRFRREFCWLKCRLENVLLDRPEPPRKKRGAVAKKGEEVVELTWAQKYMAKMQEGKVTFNSNLPSSHFTKVSGGLRKVEAPQGGTKWHKAAGDSGKLWCEAKNDDGSRLKPVYFFFFKIYLI